MNMANYTKCKSNKMFYTSNKLFSLFMKDPTFSQSPTNVKK